MSRRASVAWLVLVALSLASARADDEPAFARDPVVRGAIPPELQAVLLEADRFEALLIACERSAAPDEERFARYPIVRRVELPAGDERARLLSRVYQGIAEADQRVRVGCFEPHHGLRAWKGEQRVDVVICFKCSSLQVSAEHMRHGNSAQITSAARPELERLLGPIVDRAFAGRTLAEWSSRFRALGRRGDGPPATLESGDEEGVRVLADAIGWAGPRAGPAYTRALQALGPAAAPALPKLREHLVHDPLDPELVRWSLEVVETIGAAAADLAPIVLERLRDVVGGRVPRERLGDHPDHLARAAIRALAATGPAAREAVPLLERLAADPGRESALREEAERAVLRITGS